MKGRLLHLLAFSALAFGPSPSAVADVVYSGLQDIAIPTDFDGVYLNLDNGALAGSEFTGWDVNPFFGGQGVANSPAFQPARIGTGSEDAILALGTGVVVNGAQLFSTGFGGSASHLGSGAGKFVAGQQAYMGFKLTTDNNAGPFFGWMRVVFTANSPGGLIKDWAYETGGSPIRTGNILRTAPAGGVSLVTLSSSSGEISTLGSPLVDPGGGTITSLQKNGVGTWKITNDQSYTGDTIIGANGGTLDVGASVGKLSATRTIFINEGGTLLLSGAGGTNSKLNTGADVTLAGGSLNLGGITSSLDQAVGVLTLSANSVLDFGTLSTGNTWRFEASNADWSAVQLTVLNYTPGSDHLFFGTSSSGLNAPQLDSIRFFTDGGTSGLGFAKSIGSDGELSAIPEPASVFAGVALGLLAVGREWRRRWKARALAE